jgi:hypothetical protein
MALTTKEGGAKHKSAPKMMPQPCNAKSRTPKAHSEGFALSQLPIEVPYHSVIGQRRPGPRERGSDGVVPYWSSHLDGAQCRLQLNRRLFARHSHAPGRSKTDRSLPPSFFRCLFQLIRGLFAAYSWRGQSSGTTSAFQLVDENPFIVSLLAQPAQPAGRASAWRAESTPRGAPQGVRETRWQTDTNPSDPRSEDRDDCSACDSSSGLYC